ncbi:hypothetical protein BCh11DRAFT_05284 [Burkholderia sp. Ch1-1]|jgi:hypothetical protein|uniref:Uncharacterized protein n=1 Tax=Paraburkholderia dioscoreae TaxID=2604047 RepID=A0A5Q4Z2H7_9BURK|nr:hypothetical protein BCh11DRAFT_05284 [Burkholderia sp. Ch1-1]VVD30092.1 conserved protein of unknown function [Paraburkholderia dioscoreae]
MKTGVARVTVNANANGSLDSSTGSKSEGAAEMACVIPGESRMVQLYLSGLQNKNIQLYYKIAGNGVGIFVSFPRHRGKDTN